MPGTGDTSGRESEDYKRGMAEGKIFSRLDTHDAHFFQINGSIDRLSNEVHVLVLGLQKFSDAADARDAISVAAVKSVAEAETARQVAAERKWSSIQKLFAVVAALAAVITVAGVIITLVAK
jgi:hypothetical protein